MRIGRFFSGRLAAAAFAVLLAGTLSAEEYRGVREVVRDLVADDVAVGKTWAVFIAIDKYRYWRPLRNPVADARELREILTRRYYIDEVIELYDEEATRGGIGRLFNDLFQKVGPQDSVFLYYAGHGYLDPLSKTGFWIPADGGTDVYDQERWLSNSIIRGYVSNIKAKDVALFVDSCFSGDLLNPTRGAASEISNEYFKRAYERVSRQVVTSGASETVPDTSEFARQLRMALERNTRPYIDPMMIFNELRLGVTKTTPLFGSIQGSVHQEGGSLVLFLKDVRGAAPETSTAVASASAPAFRVERDLGAVRVSTFDAGKLYLDGVYAADVGAGRSISLRDVEAGKHTIEMRYRSHTETYEVEVVKDATFELAFVYEANPTFELSVDPGIEGLSVYVDGRFVGRTPFSGAVPAGERRVRIESEWVEVVEATVRGETRTRRVFAPEVTELGALRVVGELPSGAVVSVDGRNVPFPRVSSASGVKLPVGAHTVRVTGPTIRPLELPVDIGSGRIFTVRPRPSYRTGSLRVSGIPESAQRVELGSETLDARSLLRGLDLVIGEYRLVVPNPYGEDFVDTIRVEEGGRVAYTVPSGRLVLDEVPERMTVSIGGVEALRSGEHSLSPAAIDLLPGEYRVRVWGEDASDESFRVRIGAEETVRRQVTVDFYGAVGIEPPRAGGKVDVVLIRPDGVRTAATSRELSRLPVGEYTIMARYVDDVAFAYRTSVAVGRGDRVAVSLAELPYSPEHDLTILERDLERARNRATGGWVSFFSGLFAVGVSVLADRAGEEAMAEYRGATSTAAAEAARARVESLGGLFAVAVTGGVVGVSLAPILWSGEASVSEIKRKIASTKARIARRGAEGY